jgi:hypothetical protein
MREREQLAGRKACTSKRFVVRGDFAAMALGDLQRVKRHVAKRVCAKHTWVVSKWSQRCSVCGLVEDRQG